MERGSLVGLVSDSTGNPLSFTIVRLFGKPGGSKDSFATHTTADRSGAYRIDRIPWGEYRVEFRPRRRYHKLRVPLFHLFNVVIDAGTETSLDVVLPSEQIEQVTGKDSLSLLAVVDSVAAEIGHVRPELSAGSHVSRNALVEDFNSDGAQDIAAYAIGDSTYVIVGCFSEGERYICTRSFEDYCRGEEVDWADPPFVRKMTPKSNCSQTLRHTWHCPLRFAGLTPISATRQEFLLNQFCGPTGVIICFDSERIDVCGSIN